MTSIKRKSLIVAIITFISVLVFSQAFLMFMNKGNKANTQNSVNAAYTITDKASLMNNYNSYNEFYIYDLAGLKAFADTVYTYQQSGCSFTDKKVFLQDNIDCGGSNIAIGIKVLGTLTVSPTFNGLFEGNGYEISNFTASGSSYILSATAGGYTSHIAATGLFTRVGNSARIQNLRLKNGKNTNPSGTGGYGGSTKIHNAILVGFLGGGTIQNCEVINCSGGDGIVAAGTGRVLNCYTDTINIGPSFVTDSVNGSSITNNMSISYCISKGGSISSLTTQSFCYTSQSEGFAKLDKSHDAGIKTNNNSIWYYHQDYNGGWPKLRVFMKNWQTVQFNASAGGSVGPGSIEIPSDYALSNLTDRGSVTSMTVLGQTITATPNDGYKVVSWKRNSTTYNITFSRKLCTLSFLTGGATSQITKTGNTYYDIYEGALVQVSTTQHTQTGRYKVISYTFVAVTENGSSYTETSTTVRYTVSDKYYLTINDSKYLKNFNGAPGAANNITVSANLKNYSITLG